MVASPLETDAGNEKGAPRIEVTPETIGSAIRRAYGQSLLDQQLSDYWFPRDDADAIVHGVLQELETNKESSATIELK